MDGSISRKGRVFLVRKNAVSSHRPSHSADFTQLTTLPTATALNRCSAVPVYCAPDDNQPCLIYQHAIYLTVSVRSTARARY